MTVNFSSLEDQLIEEKRLGRLNPINERVEAFKIATFKSQDGFL